MMGMRWRDQSGPTPAPRAGRRKAGPARVKRPRIGVLVDSLRKTYQTTVLAGISELAHRRDVDIVVFAGGVLGAPRSDGINRNFVFDLAPTPQPRRRHHPGRRAGQLPRPGVRG